MNLSRRERNRQSTYEEIKTIAWSQIGETGAPSLSLRAIARELGMTAPGLYRYYPTRDDLVTALIIDAFDSFSAALEAARDAIPAGSHASGVHTARFLGICRAYFDWALAAPARYALIFGAPVPGYTLGEAAYPSARRAFLVLQGVIGEAIQAGSLDPARRLPPLPPPLLARYRLLGEYGMPHTPEATHLALRAWSAIHGITGLYLDSFLDSFLGEQLNSFLQVEISALAEAVGFTDLKNGARHANQ